MHESTPDDTYPPVFVHDVGLFSYQFLAFKNNRPQSFDWAACGISPESSQRNIELLYNLLYIALYDIKKYKTGPSTIGLDYIFVTERTMSLLRKSKKNGGLVFGTLNINLSLILASFGGINASLN